ncbi:MAG: DUF3008 family protein [Succinivibrio sp.]|nr:DUF3008 family protein [Succinivibrio sp.]
MKSILLALTIFFTAAGTVLAANLNDQSVSAQKEASMSMYELMHGSKLDVLYETSANYQMTYLSETELKWEALSEVAEGEAAVGTEPCWYYKIA